MSEYVDRLMAKHKKDSQAKEAKEQGKIDPVSMATEDDANIDFDDFVSDGEYVDDYFNEDASGDEIDLDESESEDELNTDDEDSEIIQEKEAREKKKKKRKENEIEEEYNSAQENMEQEISDEISHAQDVEASEDIIDTVVGASAGDESAALADEMFDIGEPMAEASPTDQAGLADEDIIEAVVGANSTDEAEFAAENVSADQSATPAEASTADVSADLANEAVVDDIIEAVVGANSADEAEFASENMSADQSVTPAEASTADVSADLANEDVVDDIIEAVVGANSADEAEFAAENVSADQSATPAEASTADVSADLANEDVVDDIIEAVVEANSADEAEFASENVSADQSVTPAEASTADLSADPMNEDVVEDIIEAVVGANSADEAEFASENVSADQSATPAEASTADLSADLANEDVVDDIIEAVVGANSADEAEFAAENVSADQSITPAEASTAAVSADLASDKIHTDVIADVLSDNLTEPDAVVSVEKPDVQADADKTDHSLIDVIGASAVSLIDHVVAEADINEQKVTGQDAAVVLSNQTQADEAALDQYGQSTPAQTDDTTGVLDTRAAVADMLTDDQIKHPTEAYIASREQYDAEFTAIDKSGAVVTDVQKNSENINKELTSSTQENDNRHLTDTSSQKIRNDANDSEEQKETEQKQSDFKEQSLHQFTEVANAVTRQLERGGQQIVSNAVNTVMGADENTKKGSEAFRKITRPLAEAAAIMSMAALASSYADRMKELGSAGAKADKLIASGKMTAGDLQLSKHELNKNLKEAGISHSDRSAIIKNRKDIHDMMGVRSEMQSMVATGQINIDDKAAKVLQSSKFYDLRNKEMGQLLQLYYKNSSDDVIRNVFGKGNFTGKSAGTYRRFIRKMDKNEVSLNGRAAIRMGQLASLRAKSNRELYGRLKARLTGTAISMIRNVTTYDRNTQIGSKTATSIIKTGLRTAKISKKVLIGTRRHGYRGLAVGSLRVVKKILVGTKKNGYKGVATQVGRSVIRLAKYTDKSFYALTKHSIGHFLGVTQNNIRRGKDALREQIKRNGDIAKKKALEATMKAKKKALNTAVGRQAAAANAVRINTTNAIAAKYRHAQRATREAAKKLAQTKAAKAAYATGNVVAKGANLFIGTPMRFGAGVFRKIKLGIGKVFKAFNAIKKYIFGAIMGACFAYIVLVLIFTAILSIINTDNTAVMNILLPDRDEFVTESIDRYLQKSEDIKNDAIAVGEGTPRTPTVTNGHTISKYGHPDADGNWVKGYKIYYTDSAGNIIQDGANNVKDTIVLAYVQMDGNWQEKNEGHATELMDKYFQWLNPNSDHNTLLQNSEESDIYFCDGCEEVYYTCNSDAFVTDTTRPYLKYSSVLSQKNNGAKFFGPLISKTNGDYYTTQCKGHWSYGKDKDGKPSKHYTSHGSATNRAPTGCNKYTTTKYCTGHKIKVCYGHRDITIKIPIKTMADAFSQNFMVSDHSFSTHLNGQWEEDSQDWCSCLYGADWYDLYGTDPSGGIGFTPGSSMSPEEIKQVLENCGDVSEIRQNIISSALSQVGSLPYYYGGKPTSGGVPIQTNHGTAGSTTSVEDHVGRTTAGLDCFGFCQWAYWNATGSNILPEGSSCTTTTVYNSKQCGNLKRLSGASELKVGDLGFLAGHVGIFAGVSGDGQLMWIHCNGSANTVSYGPYNGFTRYYRLKGLD